jgi:hypothetical protein
MTSLLLQDPLARLVNHQSFLFDFQTARKLSEATQVNEDIIADRLAKLEELHTNSI